MAYSHDDVGLAEWAGGWVLGLLEEGFTVETLEEFVDMAVRHPGRLREDSRPHVHTTVRRVSVPAGVEQWRPLVATYFRSEDVDRALRIMACESGGNPNAANPRSSARGLFQHLGKYWTRRSAAAGWAGASILDPTANVAVAAWLRDQPGGFSHWVCR